VKFLLSLVGLTSAREVAQAYEDGIEDGRNEVFLECAQEIGHERFDAGFAAGKAESVASSRLIDHPGYPLFAAQVEAMAAEIRGLKYRLAMVDPFGISKAMVG
jgi:hypothetical protein